MSELFTGPDGHPRCRWCGAAPEFLEQAAKELLEEQWEKVTMDKLPEATKLLEASRRIG